MVKLKKMGRQRLMVYAGIAAFLIAIILIAIIIGRPMVQLALEPERFREWVHQRGAWGQVAYIGMTMLQVIVAVIPGEPLEIAGGYAFGALEGSILCLIGDAIGSIAVLALVRIFGMRVARAFFSEKKLQSLRFLQVSRRRAILFMIIFMLPGSPKDLLCYFAALTDISLPLLILGCSLGRVPSVITSTIGGDALGTRSYLFAVLVFAATFAVSMLGVYIYGAIQRRHGAAWRDNTKNKIGI